MQKDTLCACLLAAGISAGAWAIIAWARQNSSRLMTLRQLQQTFNSKCSNGTWVHGGTLATAVAVEEACLLLGMRPSSELIAALFKLVNERWACVGVDFGTFAVFVTEMQVGTRRASIGSTHHTESPSKRSELVKKWTEARRQNPNGSGCQVFLGGSCNPTTWRKDLAVPMLEAAGVTYYNPQVGGWSTEMIATEEAAKREARIALFIIDNQTRSISSMVETAYLSASGYEIVTVIKDFELTCQIGEHVLPPDEVRDLNSAHDSLRDVLHREQVPLFNSIEMALNHIVELLRDNRSINVLAEEDFVQATPVRAPPSLTGGMNATLTEIFVKKEKRIHKDHLSRLTRSRLFRVGLKTTDQEIFSTLQHIRQYMGTEDRADIGYLEFASLIAELHNTAAHRSDDKRAAPDICRTEIKRDLFMIGLKEGEADEDVINRMWGLCEESKVTVLDGSGGDESGGSDSVSGCGLDQSAGHHMLKEPDLTSWDCCSVLLFHISPNRRSIDMCIQAAHAIGVGSRPMVLCMDMTASAQGSTFLTDANGKLLEDRELRDINRGRHYLEDIAKHNGVFLCSDLEEATTEAIRLVAMHTRR